MNSYTLRDLVKIKNGKDHKSQNTGTIPVYGSGGLMLYVDKPIYDRESVLLPRKGTLDNIQYVDHPFWTVDTIYYTEINNSKAVPYYLYYYLKQLNLSKLNTGTGVPSMTFDSYYDVPVKLPSLVGQKKIASVLSALDDKIELNRKINAELEQMARTLYDYWFVQCDFPDANGKPYKSSGGAMNYCDQLKRTIPANWSVGTLASIITRCGTGLNPRHNFKLGSGNNFYVTIKNIVDGKLILDDKCDQIDDEALRTIQKRSDLQKGDVLFTSIQPVGVTYLVQERPSNWNINESVFTLRPDYAKVTSEYLYMLLSSKMMKTYTANASAGSVHKGIRHSVLKDFKLAYPDQQLINKFTGLMSPILGTIDLNNKESRELSQLRDWLLPMLMTGQIKVV